MRRWEAAAPVLAARGAVLLGVLLILDALLPHGRHMVSPLASVLSRPTRATAAAVVGVSGVAMLRVAAALRKRKRVAWRVAVSACAAVVVADLFRGERRPVEALLTTVVLVGLIATRHHFTAVSDPHRRWFAARLFLQILAVALVYGVTMLSIGDHVRAGTSFGARVGETLASMVGLGGTIPLRGRHFADTFHATLLVWGLAGLLTVVVVLLRSSEPEAALPPAEEHRLRDLLARQGARDSLGYFALRRDKSVVWSPTGKAAVTYRVVAGVALISGDPIGDPEAWPGALATYRALALHHGWTEAAMGCSELGATVLHRDLGLATIALGDEAILDVDSFSLEGRPMRGVRQACTRVRRAGYDVTVRRVRNVAPDEWDALRAASSAWRVDPVERGFSMALSRLGDASDGDCVVVTAELDGELRGLLHFAPWGGDGLSLDLMRRDRRSDNGLNEFMIATLMAACLDLGVRRVSLNFAVFRDALERGGQLGAGPVLRLWRRLLLIASRWWQIESLYRFNEKFQPQWQPRFFSYPAARDIPRVALAAMEAEAFLARPRVLKRLTGRA